MMSPRIMLLAVLLLAGCAAEHPPLAVPAEAPAALSRANWGLAGRVDVGLESFDFVPDTLRFELGRPYVVHLQNLAKGGHNFDAPAFFSTVALADGPAERRLRAAGGVIELAGGAVTDIRLIPLKSGTYPLICSHPLHEEFGMSGKIIVR